MLVVSVVERDLLEKKKQIKNRLELDYVDPS